MNIDETISLSNILVAILSIIATGFGFIIKEQKEKIKNIQNQLSDKKYRVYHEIYAIFFDIFKQQKGLTKEDKINNLTIRLIDIKKDLFIYAPDHVVKKFLEWNSIVTGSSETNRHFKIFLELFVLIRKDMGHLKTGITDEDILRSIMSSEEDFQKLKKSITA
jgi:hypothetical protein